jgi:hypothetical protein
VAMERETGVLVPIALALAVCCAARHVLDPVTVLIVRKAGKRGGRLRLIGNECTVKSVGEPV